MENKEEKDFRPARFSWDRGAYRKLLVTIDISDLKNTFCIFNKKWKGE